MKIKEFLLETKKKVGTRRSPRVSLAFIRWGTKTFLQLKLPLTFSFVMESRLKMQKRADCVIYCGRQGFCHLQVPWQPNEGIFQSLSGDVVNNKGNENNCHAVL